MREPWTVTRRTASLMREHRQLLRALRAELADPRDPDSGVPVVEAQPETVAVYERALAALGESHRGATSQSERAETVHDESEEVEALAA